MMLSTILCLAAFASLVCSTASPLKHFKNISDTMPKNNIDLLHQAGRSYKINIAKSMDQALEECAAECLEFSFLCHYFVIFEQTPCIPRNSNGKERFCQLYSNLGARFQTSPNQPFWTMTNALAVYEYIFDIGYLFDYSRWRNLPTEQDMIKRFFYRANGKEMEENLGTIAHKYGIYRDVREYSDAILKHIKPAFDSKLPKSLKIESWLNNNGLSDSQAYFGNYVELAQGLQSWKSWPQSLDSPLEFSDIIVLTFLEIFFRNLDQDIKTVFDPVAKILIIEGDKVHMMISSFGPGDYVLVNARNPPKEGDRLTCEEFYVTNDARLDDEQAIMELFAKAMKRFGNEVSSDFLHPFCIADFGNNNLELGIKVIINAVGLGLLSKVWLHHFVGGLDVLFRDVVTALVTKAAINESKLQSTLLQALRSTSTPSKMIDVDIII